MQTLSLWLPVAACMALIFYLSSRSDLPGSGLTPDWLEHGLAYGALALVSLRALARGRWAGIGVSAVVGAWLLATAFGASDEWHQAFVPGRNADVRDLFADTTGAAFALGAAWAWSIIRRSS